MRFRFLHMADCHLGNVQYNSRDRYNDFGRAFLAVIDAAISAKVDFVVLAGDLFQKRAIDALTLNQAWIGLTRLKDAQIPCIAVEGNHEFVYYAETVGWLQFVAMKGLLTLLHPEFKDGAPVLTRYGARRGSFEDVIPGVRVHGLRYMGAGTASAVAKYAEALAQLPNDGIDYTIFVAHSGVEGVVGGEIGGLSLGQWAVLRPHVDYLALGHVHKPFTFDDWIYNPGSTETCSSREAEWTDRGYYLVDVDTDQPGDGPKHHAQLRANPRRTFYRLQVKVDLLPTPSHLIDACQELFTRKARDWHAALLPPEQRPVVELMLTGALPFDRNALDLSLIEEMLTTTFDPLLVQIKNVTTLPQANMPSGEGLDRSQLELEIITQLLSQNAEFRDHSQEWAAAALELKKLALDGAAPNVIIDELAAVMDKLNA